MWFYLAFGAAVLGAVDVILNKRCLEKVGAVTLSWALFSLSLPIIAWAGLINGIPSLNQWFWLGVAGSAMTFIFSKTFMNTSLKTNDVSKIYPLTAFSGIFTYLLGLLFLSETIRPVPLMGLLAVILGSYVLNADKAKEHILKPFTCLLTNKASLVFLVGLLLNSITTIFDKTGINNTSPTNPGFTLLAENLIMVGFLSGYLGSFKRHAVMKEVRSSFWLLLLNSLVYAAMSLLVFAAFGSAPVALVMGIKRLQIFFILILGALFLHDRPSKQSWYASAIMAIGVLLIKLG